MILSSIILNNIRVHQSFKSDFAEGLNYVVGRNGLGKTTILEAIYYLCTTKSCLSAADQEVLSFDENDFSIEGMFSNRTNHRVKLSYTKSENKKIYSVDDKKISRFSEAIGKFPIVILLPSDYSITQGAPADRRKFVDSVISQANKNYLETLIEFNRILKQRSALLQRNKVQKTSGFREELNVWTSRLVDKGSELIKYRMSFISRFNSYVEESYKIIMGTTETPAIIYFYLDGYDGSSVEDRFRQRLIDRADDEIWRGANLVGPHRDDFVFELSGINLKTFGSQGQHKTFQTVLRFAEFFYLKDITGLSPILLLDDVFGELDAHRAGRISEYLGEVGQTFITLTDFSNFSFLKTGEKDNIIKLENNSEVYV